MLAWDKHSSLLGPFISFEENEVLWMCSLVCLSSTLPCLTLPYSQSCPALAGPTVKIFRDHHSILTHMLRNAILRNEHNHLRNTSTSLMIYGKKGSIRHASGLNLGYSSFGRQAFGWKAFGRQTFGRQAFGCQAFGSCNVGSTELWPHHFDNKSLFIVCWPNAYRQNVYRQNVSWPNVYGLNVH